MNFAKLFNYETGQLLVTMQKDFSPDKVEVSYRSDTEELSVEQKKTYHVPAMGVEAFEEFGEPDARRMFDGMQNMMRR